MTHVGDPSITKYCLNMLLMDLVCSTSTMMQHNLDDKSIDTLLHILHDLKRSAPKKLWTPQLISQMKRLVALINRKMDAMPLTMGTLEYFHAVCA